MNQRQKALESLLVSKVRIKALELFFLHPSRSIHLRAAVRELNEEINAVRRELLRLEESKIVNGEIKGNRKYFELNLDHPFFSDLISIFHKTFGLGSEIISNSKKLGEIEFAFLSPLFTKGARFGSQPVDLFIVGDIDMNILNSIISNTEEKINREIHYAVLKPSDFALRKRRKDQFIIDLTMQDIVMLVGSQEALIK